MSATQAERLLQRDARYRKFDDVRIYDLSSTDPVALLHGHGLDYCGISCEVETGAAALAIVSPHAALLIPVPEPPRSPVEGTPLDNKPPETYLKSILDGIARYFNTYQTESWPLSDSLRVVLVSRCSRLPKDVCWRVIKPFLEKCDPHLAKEGMLHEFELPLLEPDQSVNVLIYEKRGFSYLTLRGYGPEEPPYFPIGAEHLEDRARPPKTPKSKPKPKPKVEESQPPESASSASGGATSKGKGKGNAEEVQSQPPEPVPPAPGTSTSKGKGKGNAKDVQSQPPEPAPSASGTSILKRKGKAKKVRFREPECTPAVPQETSASQDKDRDKEGQHEEILSDWQKKTGFRIPAPRRTESRWPRSSVKSRQSRRQERSAPKKKSKGVQRESSSARPQSSTSKDKGKKSKRENVQRVESSPSESQEPLAPQDGDKGLPGLDRLSLPIPEDDGQGLPPLATLGLPAPEEDHQDLPPLATLGFPTASDMRKGLSATNALWRPSPPANVSGVPCESCSAASRTSGDRGHGAQHESSSATSQTLTSEDRGKGVQHESSSGVSQTSTSGDRGHGAQHESSSATSQTSASGDRGQGAQHESSSATSQTSTSRSKGEQDPCRQS
ncbi:hypothetical protein BJY00DRAFT_313178 [Aspergillus carlsbadensis]|nr:hypothetical protein BJY00DRAFT_313178 [Aspergillus carlsbadensis]